MAWEVVIGLETHAQLSTQSKIFSGASTAFSAADTEKPERTSDTISSMRDVDAPTSRIACRYRS